MRSGELKHSASQGGFAYVLLLAVVAALGLALSAVATAWSRDASRERERELLRIGALYADAIASYHAAAPGSVRRYPPDLQSLLEDQRFVGVRRHLRRLHADPMNPRQPWVLLRAPDGGVRGVASSSVEVPWRREAMRIGRVTLAPAGRYADWQFVPELD